MNPQRAEARSVILYELNEVPWRVVDLYTADRPSSTLASLIASGLSLTTENHDPVPLQPRRTWQTFHASMYTDDHNSFDLGQDPSTLHREQASAQAGPGRRSTSGRGCATLLATCWRSSRHPPCSQALALLRRP